MSPFGAFLQPVTARDSDEDKERKKVFWEFLETWWKGLDDDRGARARLRRAKTPLDVFISPDFQRGVVAPLAARGLKLTMNEQEFLALGVGLLAHVRTLKREPHFARQLAPEEEGQKNMRDPRFRKLLAITDRDELFVMLRRLLAYLGNAAEMKSLVTGAFWWSETTRSEWASEYYVNRPAKHAKS